MKIHSKSVSKIEVQGFKNLFDQNQNEGPESNPNEENKRQ